jgi:DNA-binding XRE family transcriptional regulator
MEVAAVIHHPEEQPLEVRLAMKQSNNVKKLREAKMISKAEFARVAGISPLTLDRIEKGMACRMSTKRKITLALGLKTSEGNKVFK